LWSKIRGGGGRLGEGGGVVFVCDDATERSEGAGFAAVVGGGCWLEAELGHGGDGEVVPRAGEVGVGFVGFGTLGIVEVGVWRGLILGKVEGGVTGVGEGFGNGNGAWDVTDLFGCLEIVSLPWTK